MWVKLACEAAMLMQLTYANLLLRCRATIVRKSGVRRGLSSEAVDEGWKGVIARAVVSRW